MSDPPNSAADPRPGNRPYYIAPDCPTCGAALVLADRLERPDAPDDVVWHDEWTCPTCRSGIWLDWPASMRERDAQAASDRELPVVC